MKKTIFMLTALLLIAPAMAAVDINCVHTGSGVVEIRYDAAEDGNLPRGIGIEISVDSGAQITAVTDLSTDFWVHPGDINIVDGNVVDEGSPVVGTLPASSIILEMGSLHYPAEVTSPNAPPSSGVLVEITVDADCNVTISGEADRGEVVNYEAEAAVAIYTGCQVTLDGVECFDSGHAKYDEWVAVGKPECWCYTYQCNGDADGQVGGTAKDGYFQVENADMTILLGAWKKDDPNLTGVDICADFNRSKDGTAKDGYFRVENADMTILLGNWKDDPNLTGGCGGSL
jgi:hypothetical protein